MTFPETFFPLSRFREISHLSIYRVSSVDNFDLPLMAFGAKLVKLELKNCTNFQSGTALNIRKYCCQLKSLILEIDSTDANSNAGLSEALGEQNILTLQNQIGKPSSEEPEYGEPSDSPALLSQPSETDFEILTEERR